MKSPKSINRRSFLTYATLSTSAVVLGSGIWGLAKSVAPSADVAQEKWAPKINLNNLRAGKPEIIAFNNFPVFALRLTDEQLLGAQEELSDELHDPFAQNANLFPDAKAIFENRSIESNGSIVILDGRCPRRGCRVVYDVGDFSGWFCPCGGSHFDVLGRFRKGISPTNMRIPRFTISNDTELTLLEGPQPVTEIQLNQLVYGNDGKD